MRSIQRLVWDDWYRKHIKKQNVTAYEVEEAYTSQSITKQSYQNRIVLIGKTKKGRTLTIVISKEKQAAPYIVSARDASKRERRYYNEQNPTNKTI